MTPLETPADCGAGRESVIKSGVVPEPFQHAGRALPGFSAPRSFPSWMAILTWNNARHAYKELVLQPDAS